MEATKLVTVIVPCFNYGHFLKSSLESVLNQSYPNWECLIIDDGSTDNTEEVAMGFCERDRRFKYIYQNNQGLAAARNSGLRYANGDYIQFLDADDLIERRKIEVHVGEAKTYNRDLVYGDSFFFWSDAPSILYANKEKTSEVWTYNHQQGASLKEYIFKSNFATVSAPLIKRTLIAKVGMFDTRLTSNEDWDFWIRCAISNPCISYKPGKIGATLIRVSESSMMSNHSNHLLNEIFVRVKYVGIKEEYARVNKIELRRQIFRYFKMAIKQAFNCSPLKGGKMIIQFKNVLKFI